LLRAYFEDRANMNKQLNDFFKPEDIVYTYTSNQAVEDGLLFDLDQVRKYLPKNPFKYATANLMSSYFDENRLNS
jgi:type I site-specific restriction endonuclease